MAFQLAQAYVSLSNRGFNSVTGGIAEIQRRMNGLGPATAGVTSGMASSVMALGPVLAGAAAGVAGITASLYGAGTAIMRMVDLASNLEQVETRFKTLLGSAEAAEQMVSDLASFAASTPFQMDGLTQTAQTLLAFGVTQEQVIPTMKALGDVAAASGADINELGNIYGKVRANGRLMTESLDQFNERAIPVGATLARLFGKTEAEIRQMASRGEISFADLQQAMVDMTSQGGMAFDGMASQSQTLGGLWSTLSDNITLAMTDVGTALMDGFDLKGVTADIIDFTSRVRGEWLPSIVAGFQWLGSSIVTPMVVGIRQVLDTVFDFVGNFDLYWELAGLSVANFAINSFERIRVFFINMLETADWAWSNWQQYLALVSTNTINIFANITENIRSVWQALLDWVAGQGFNPDFKPLLDGVRMVWEVVPELTKASLDKLQPDIDRIYAQLDMRRQQAEERANASPAGGGPDALAIDRMAPAIEPGGAASGSKADRASFVGIAQLAEQMQAQAGAAQDRQRQVAAAEAAAEANRRVAAKAEGDGLRVQVVGWNVGAESPNATFEFGT